MDDDSGDEHHPGLFDCSVLDSLNRLTDEIHEDLRADDDSAADIVSGSYNSDDDYDDAGYSDYDDDPESGENQLFSMMDDLVMELQMELKQTGEGDLGGDIAAFSPPLWDVQDVLLGANEEEAKKSTPKPSPSNENTENNRVVSSDPKSYGGQGLTPPVDCTNLPQTPNSHSKSEKQLRLQQHVKSLLRRVADLTSADQEGAGNSTSDNCGTASSTVHSSPKIASLDTQQLHPTAGVLATPNQEDPNRSFDSVTAGPRQRGSSSAEKLERLLGAISSYKSLRDPMNHTTSQQPGRGVACDDATSGDHQNSGTIGPEQIGPADGDVSTEGTNNAARAISNYTQRMRREYLIRKQTSNDGDLERDQLVDKTFANAEDVDNSPSRNRRSKTSRETLINATEPATPQIVLTRSEEANPIITQDLALPGQHLRRQPPSTNKKKKTKRRTNKHKTRRTKRDLMHEIDGQQRLIHEPADPISQQSLRTLLASLLALDDRLSEQTARLYAR